jgi:hypothetical protein
MKEYNNIKPKFAYEFFAAIEKSDDKVLALKQFGANPPLSFLLPMNFDSRVVFDLPPGMPPYNRNNKDHPDLYAPLSSGIRRVMLCLASDRRQARWKKEQVFIQMLEGVNTKEADILILAKDRQLQTMYPWLTAEVVKEAFPTYVN